uniref:RING-type domain-containing protein n=1 Tax=Erpetoichthys calabaricus TaxID=27687 RepID=A0A8C4RCX4_ERPCA
FIVYPHQMSIPFNLLSCTLFLDISPTFVVPLILTCVILTFFVTPRIHLNILISATSNFSCAPFTAHVSALYIIAVERLQSQNDIASRSFVSPDPLDWENFNAFSVYYSESDIPGTSCPVPYTEYLYMFVINSNISGPRGLSREQIDSIATRTLQENDGLSSCRICLLTYKQGVQLRSLPCFHEFHMNCIDHWLLINSTCPVCRNPAIVSDISEPGSRGQAEMLPTHFVWVIQCVSHFDSPSVSQCQIIQDGPSLVNQFTE